MGVPSLSTVVHAQDDTKGAQVIRGLDEFKQRDVSQEARHLDATDEPYPVNVVHLIKRAPKLETVAIAGRRFRDEHLEEMAANSSLRAIILDSTCVTEEGIAKVHRQRPELVVYRSQRQARLALNKLALELRGDRRKNVDYPELENLYGEEYFWEVTEWNMHALPDTESGPWDPILAEELFPLQMLHTLEVIHLQHCEFNDASMHYLKDLKHVRKFTAPLKDVSDEAKRHIAGWTKLTYFEGALNDRSAGYLSDLHELEKVTIRSPDFTDEGLVHLEKLHNITWLNLSGTGIKGPGLVNLSRLKALQSLYLQRCNIRGDHWHHLKKLSQLERLNLKEANTGNLQSLHELPGLRYLNLEQANVPAEAWRNIAKCRSLESLWAYGASFSHDSAEALRDHPKLKELMLHETRLTDEALALVCEIENLTHLYIGRTQVTNHGLRHLQKLRNLKSLSFHGLAIDDEGEEHLKKLPMLDSLYLGGPGNAPNADDIRARHERIQQAIVKPFDPDR